MVSLAVQALVLSLARNWSSPTAEPGTWENLTNGPYGLAGIPRPVIFGIKCDTISSMAILSTTLSMICLALGCMLLRSPWGRVLQAMRDDEHAARGLGKNVRLLKLQAFAIACAMSAVAGSLYASYVSYIEPNLSSIDQSILLLSMVIVGGTGNLHGPLVGAVILLAIPEGLRFAQIPDAIAAETRLMAYGLLLILLMHLGPQGMAGRYRIE